MSTKKILLTIGICFAGLWGLQAQEIAKPTIQTKTSFAIVVDQDSYREAKSAVDAYRQSVEADGLGTYLVVINHQRPEEIRNLLIEFHADRKSPLEGCVFVGDVPIPMIRDAQHLTSAFKMNQKNDWKESSVASDRYYDDFGLTFDFLKQDSDRPLYYYYTLRADSKHHISPDIYSGRIKPVVYKGSDKYQLLRDYLNKVVAEKNDKLNVVDYLTMARGHGYNSEDRLAWAGEQIALTEQFPILMKPGGTVRYMDFDQVYPAKKLYLNQALDQQIDILLFHHHGAPDTEYLNGEQSFDGIDGSIDNIKRFLRSKVAAAAEKSGKEEAIARYMKNYGVPREWCEEAFDAEKQKADSIYNAMKDIYTSDIHQLTPNARFILFDACYNGSFYEDDYIAGAYIFAKGKTIATIGGTVNAIQDKWPDEGVGLLAAGMRVGQFNRLTCFLENHLIGDPTFHFADNSGLNFNINEAMTLRRGDTSFWLKLVAPYTSAKQLAKSRKSPSTVLPDLQALALRELDAANYAGMPDLLKRAYFHSNSFVVRLEAMRLLALNYPDQSTGVLKESINDSYELVRRFSGEYIAKNGNPELLPAFVNAFVERHQEARLKFKIQTYVAAFDSVALKNELARQLKKRAFYDDSFLNSLKSNISSEGSTAKYYEDALSDPKAKASTRRFAVSKQRNQPYAHKIELLLSVLKDTRQDKELRIQAAEALGWYNLSYRKQDILSALRAYQADDEQVRYEVTKTINRLLDKCR